ncbi:MAG: DUF512 domain-containing protein, partial [Actinobacteria bacterium]|nr:DUF512 domain-containing protein [Actinomycetota bacterium]
NKLFGNNNNFSALENLKILDKNKVRTNIQIVLCPGINDSKDLENTLNNLTRKFKRIQSIGIVPVGITRYNKNKDLKSYDKHKSLSLIEYLRKYRLKNIDNKNIKKIYLSDEFYIMSGKEFPYYSDYGRFLQIQNGIGKSADFLNEIKNCIQKKIKLWIKNKNNNNTYNNILIVTSEYGIVVLEKALRFINAEKKSANIPIKNTFEIAVVRNKFFGGNVKVTGLLTGTDIINTLRVKDLTKYNRVLIPDCIFNKNGLTLDDYKLKDLETLDCSIKIIRETACTLISLIL